MARVWDDPKNANRALRLPDGTLFAPFVPFFLAFTGRPGSWGWQSPHLSMSRATRVSVGVAEVVAHPHRHLDFVVDGLCASVADAELVPGRPAALARGPGGVSVANPPRELRLPGALALKAACSVYRAMMTVTNSGIIFSRSRLRPVGFRTSLPGS